MKFNKESLKAIKSAFINRFKDPSGQLKDFKALTKGLDPQALEAIKNATKKEK